MPKTGKDNLTPKPIPIDFFMTDHGTTVNFVPATEDAVQWWKNEVNSECMGSLESGFVVEHRYANAIFAGIVTAGYSISKNMETVRLKSEYREKFWDENPDCIIDIKDAHEDDAFQSQTGILQTQAINNACNNRNQCINKWKKMFNRKEAAE